MKPKFTIGRVLVPLVCFAFIVGGVVSSASAGLLTDEYEVIMKDYHFHIMKNGNETKSLELTGGLPAVITLRNEDPVAHEFISPLFVRVPVAMSGDATLVSTKQARGFRLNAGQSVRLEFVPPVNEEGDAEFDAFWCNIHGKGRGSGMRGEVFIAQTITGTGAF